ncbi:MAG: hypothetical protein MUO54_00800 [Anaerolineales bacterium]|nr:hypothetical protein [Anaerolineales bacterium]
MPITISRQMVNQALNIMHEDELVHFDFDCPKCKKTNHASKEKLLHASPAWEYEPLEKPAEKEKPIPKAKTESQSAAKPKAEPKIKPKAK